MKVLLKTLQKELTPDNMTAAISCLIISITVFFIMSVLGRDIPL
ncbi:hypothetical protein [Flagellimonas meishanensis]|nr:hypothetical protein [[Muricauda] meishanensis]